MIGKKHSKKQKRKPKSWYGKVWHFIWEEDSIASWLVNIVLAFILIKFIVYPGLGFAFGTSHPIVAVVSGSMEHRMVHPCAKSDGMRCIERDTSRWEICGKVMEDKEKIDLAGFWKYCGNWYEQRGITREEFAGYSLTRGFNRGDLIILLGKPPKNIKRGDVTVFYGGRAEPIIHRIIGREEIDGTWHFATKGDHNADQIKNGAMDESSIPQERVIGVALFRIPYIGYVKIAAVETLCMVQDFSFCIDA
ncbi:TPA: signal peptidase I [Candidatus Woesearchaeota archaeon]|nr:signal peptidase I [Candidatus Woesearchaeota archaeon]HII69177.1 signal peptidase I [Candidatus Woesearchaeota archaeon]